MKKIFTLLAVFALTLTAMAPNEASLTVTGRNNDVLTFIVKNNFPLTGVGVKVKLPEGVTVALNEDEEEIIKKNNTRAKGSNYTFDVKSPSDNVYSINLACPQNLSITGEDGEVFYMKLDGTLSGTVEVYDINFSDQGDGNDPKTINAYYQDGDKTAKIYVELNPDAINAISAEQTKSGVIYNLNGQRVSKAQKGIFVVDGKKVAVK